MAAQQKTQQSRHTGQRVGAYGYQMQGSVQPLTKEEEKRLSNKVRQAKLLFDKATESEQTNAKYDEEINNLYEERIAAKSGNINQAFVDLHECIQEQNKSKMETYQLIPYGSAINGLLDGDQKHGDLDLTLIVKHDTLSLEQIESSYTLDKVKECLRYAKLDNNKRQYPEDKI